MRIGRLLSISLPLFCTLLSFPVPTPAQTPIDWQESMQVHRTLVDSLRRIAQLLAPSPWQAPLRLWEGRGPVGGSGGTDFSVRIESQLSLGAIPDLAMVGDVTFLLCQYGLVAVNTSDHGRPRILSIFDAQGAEFMDVTGNTVLFTTKSQLLMAVDISNPAAPRLVGSLALPAPAAFVKASHPYAYVWHFDGNRIWLVDISRPEQMQILKVHRAPGPVFDLLPEGDLLYACVDQEVWALRLDPDLRLVPIARGETELASGIAMDTKGGRLFVADLVGITSFAPDGGSLRVAFQHFTPGVVSQMQIVGDYIWWADMYAGLQVLNIADPQAPYIGAWVDIPGFASCIAVNNDYACVGGQNGLYVVTFTPLGPGTQSVKGRTINLEAVVRILVLCSEDRGITANPEYDLDCDGTVSRADAMLAIEHLYRGADLPRCR